MAADALTAGLAVGAVVGAGAGAGAPLASLAVGGAMVSRAAAGGLAGSRGWSAAWSGGWGVALGVVAGLLVVWAGLVVALWIAMPDRTTIRGILRLLPDVVRLVRRLAADRDLPRGVRARLWLLLGYLALPFDLVPDVIPVLGYADDAVVVALVLRSVARRAGRDAIVRSWPGTPEGLAAVLALCGIDGRRAADRGDAAPFDAGSAGPQGSSGSAQ